VVLAARPLPCADANPHVVIRHPGMRTKWTLAREEGRDLGLAVGHGLVLGGAGLDTIVYVPELAAPVQGQLHVAGFPVCHALGGRRGPDGVLRVWPAGQARQGGPEPAEFGPGEV
jgi:hypothetical protein